jgi:hypothetical protein
MSEMVFEVLTEFVFDVQGAVENSKTLRGAVDTISSAADGAFFSLNRLAEFAAHGLGANLSVMGTLGAALMGFDKFKKTQIGFANIIAANMEHLTGNVVDFNDQLQVSRQIMMDVSKIAKEYSLDESSLMGTTKTLAAFLTPHGLSGKNMGGAIDLARMFEKSAPTLQMDPSMAQGELIRLVSGQASMGDTLFRRLATETKAMQPFGGGSQHMPGMHQGQGGAQLFNMLPMAKRFELINKAMGQFSNNAEVNAANAGLLSNQLKVLKNEFIGFNSVLLPLGEVLTNNIKPVLKQLIDFIDKYGRPAIEKLALGIQKMFENPERVYATIRQLQQARGDLQSAISLTHVLGQVLMVRWVMGMPYVRAAVMGLASALYRVAGAALGLTRWFAGFGSMTLLARGFAVLRFAMSGVLFVLNRVILPLTIIFTILQLLSRAKGYANALDVEALAKNGEKLAKIGADISKGVARIVLPFEMVFDTMARSLAPLFQYATYLQVLADNLGLVNGSIDGIGKFTLYATAGMMGLAAVMRQFLFANPIAMVQFYWGAMYTIVTDWGGKIIERFKSVFEAILNGDFGGAKAAATKPMGLASLGDMNTMTYGEMGGIFKETAFDFINDFQKRLKDPQNQEKSISNSNTYISNVNVRQDFKENMEPDRIAHSFLKTLKDVATNPTQAAGRSFAGAMTR